MRSITLEEYEGKAKDAPINVTRDELLVVDVASRSDQPVIMTIGNSAGGKPILEIPGIGRITLSPIVVQALKEGAAYPYNIWVPSGAGYMRIFKGDLRIDTSIAPSGVDVVTTFLNGLGVEGGATRVQILSLAAYGVLEDTPSDVIYFVYDTEEGA